jgi:uncharacterized membrane protein YqjE
MQHDADAGAAQPGLMAGFGGLARNMFALLVSRIELAALELGEVRDNLVRLLLIGALGVVALCFALACWTGLVIALAWDALGWKILLIVAIAYTLLAAVILLRAQALLSQNKLSMPAMLAELRSDREALM